MAAQQLCSRFSITQAKSLVKDLSVPNAKIYWTDFLISIIGGHASFSLCLNAAKIFGNDPLTVWSARAVLFALASILYMRSVMFIHELVHLRAGTFRGFRIAWNVLCGIPFMTPSFLYYPHVDHHRRKSYGTDHDGEYLDLSHRHPANLLLFIVAAAVVPVAAFIRFLVMAPISWFGHRFRSGLSVMRAAWWSISSTHVVTSALKRVALCGFKRLRVSCAALRWFCEPRLLADS